MIKARELGPGADTNDEGETKAIKCTDVAMLEAMLWQLGGAMILTYWNNLR